MYIFELVAQLFKKKKYLPQNSFDPLTQEPEEFDESENCNHMFLPLDSSNTLFACKYCGLIMPREKLKDRNLFRNNN